MSFEREKTDENIDRKYENSYNTDFMMMRKYYMTLHKKTGKFGENTKNWYLPGLEPEISWLRTSSCFTRSLGSVHRMAIIIYKH